VAFIQEAPTRSNRALTDPVLRSALRRLVPSELLTQPVPALGGSTAEDWLTGVGEIAATRWPELAARAEADPPTLTRFDAWGRRVDRIDVAPEWLTLVDEGRAAGVVSLGYDGSLGSAGRLLQFLALDLYMPVSATADCPLSMTDAAARVLLNESPDLAARYVPGLTSRDADGLTSGQWMTEREGGSDVGRTSTVARRHPDGTWTLHGTKWFTSATTADIALVLARPEGAGEGSRALWLFCVELRNADGTWNGIEVRRLKDKLGTKALPTAELDLDGAVATPVGEGEGVRRIAAMLNITRVHAAFGGVAALGEGLSLVRSYAATREAFGRPLRDLPLHRRWIAEQTARYEASSALAYHAAALLGMVEHGEAAPELARVVIPLAKLYCARNGTDGASQIIESFGGAGYVEDTGLPRILRDVHVNCIWEGTTSVMALDVLRALRAPGALDAVVEEARRLVAPHRGDRALDEAVVAVDDAIDQLAKELEAPEEADARRLAWGLAETVALALVVDAAGWALRTGDARASISTRLLAARPLLAVRPTTTSADEGLLAFGTDG
jgi:alkylation response protein AidB-like acyl-CoA dehydrogenase